MDVFKKSVQSGLGKVRDYSLSLVSGEKENIFNIQAEDTFLRDIIYSIKKLDHLSSLTTDDKLEAILRIGVVSWTGTSKAQRKASTQIPRLIHIFSTEEYEVKLEVVKALAQICILQRYSQDILKEEGFLDTMLTTLKVHSHSSMDLNRWMIYCLTCALINNVTNQKYVLSKPGITETLAAYKTETWYGMRRNEADFLCRLLGEKYGANSSK